MNIPWYFCLAIHGGKDLYQFVVMGIATAGKATSSCHGYLHYGKEQGCASEGI